MRIAICDDDKKERDDLVNAVHCWDPTRKVECFADAGALLDAAKVTPFFDIVFLDIYMPNENGMEAAKSLLEISPRTEIVFVTTSKDHAVSAFSLNALHYIVKPITAGGVAEAFRRLSQACIKPREKINLTSGKNSYSVYMDEITYIQSDRHFKEVHMIDGRYFKVSLPLDDFAAMLSGSFIKLTRSSIANMDYIERMYLDYCVLRDGTRLDMPRRERGAIRRAYNDYLFNKLSEQSGFEEK